MKPSHHPHVTALVAALTVSLAASLAIPPVLADAAQASTSQSGTSQPDIPFQQFTLANGLQVIVNEDHKAPVVAINVMYRVGSKNEPAGRSGFAHLFEHLMFNGSENHPGDYFPPFEQAGATDQNGTTNTDRTNYFETVPSTAVDMALWMESDRMGHLLGAIDQHTLDEQRGVVQNEKRQGENQPYGQLGEVTAHVMYPEGHPYHHTTIGSMNDLNAASLDDVKTWFKTWYGPNNAVLVLSGDIDLATAKEKVAKYFGDIPATPTMAQPKADIAPLAQHGRTVLQDKVPQVRVQRLWNVPQYGSKDADLLDLFQQVLGGSASSRLDQRLIYQDKLVDRISTGNYGSMLSGQFNISALVKQGVDEAKVEGVIDEELEKLLRDGPSAEELARAKTSYRASFIRGIESVGGFSGKADMLASCAVLVGSPDCFRESLRNVDAATPEEVRAVAQKWLSKPSHLFVVEPGARTPLTEDAAEKPAPFVLPKPDKKYVATASTVDRKLGVPQVTRFPELKFPALQRAKLDNGTTVVLAERHDVPLVQFEYQFGGGYSSDPQGKPGIASFSSRLLGEGAGDLDALAFKSRAEDLGADIDASTSLDANSVSLSALKENLVPSLQLFADEIERPRFEQKDIDRTKAQWIAGIKQEKARPVKAALRLLPPLLYGDKHPYGIPFTGSGTEASISALQREHLLNWQRQWLRPENATLIVVGDTTLAEIVPQLNAVFGNWKGTVSAPKPVAIPQVARPAKPRVFLIDQPGAVQATIFAGELVPSNLDPNAVKLGLSNDVLGGEFSSRINMNLREDKHWAYGAYTMLEGALGQSAFFGYAPVQIDKTAESASEMLKEISDYATGVKPATQAEVDRVVANDLRSQPGAYETAGAVLNQIFNMQVYHRPDDWVQQRNAQVAAFTPVQANEQARQFDPKALTWVIVGDLSKIETPVRELGIGEVTVLDADGKPRPGK